MSDADYLATIARTAIASGNAGYSAGMKVGERDAQRKLDCLIAECRRVAASSHSEWVASLLYAAATEASKP